MSGCNDVGLSEGSAVDLDLEADENPLLTLGVSPGVFLDLDGTAGIVLDLSGVAGIVLDLDGTGSWDLDLGAEPFDLLMEGETGSFDLSEAGFTIGLACTPLEPPVDIDYRLTESGDFRITESGDRRIVEAA